MDKALVSDLRHHFDDDGIVELTAHIAFQILSSKFNAALDIPSQGLCQMPGPGQTAKPGSDTQEGQKGPGP